MAFRAGLTPHLQHIRHCGMQQDMQEMSRKSTHDLPTTATVAIRSSAIGLRDAKNLWTSLEVNRQSVTTVTFPSKVEQKV